MADHFLALIAEGLDNTQRNQIHAAVKKYADSWWHEFLDVWLVFSSETGEQWRDRLRVIFGTGGAQLLVLRLPDETPRGWSTIMRRPGSGKTDWLREVYSRPIKEVRESLEEEPPF